MKILSKEHVDQMRCDIPIPSILIASHEALRTRVERLEKALEWAKSEYCLHELYPSDFVKAVDCILSAGSKPEGDK